MINQELCHSICVKIIEKLGKKGKPYPFDEESFQRAYNRIDKFGVGRVSLPMLVGIVTQMISERSSNASC